MKEELIEKLARRLIACCEKQGSESNQTVIDASELILNKLIERKSNPRSPSVTSEEVESMVRLARHMGIVRKLMEEHPEDAGHMMMEANRLIRSGRFEK